MVKEPGELAGEHRSKSRRAVMVGLVTSAVISVTTAAVILVGNTIGQEAADRSLAEVDAHRLIVEVDHPGMSCDYGGTYGYGKGDDLTQWGVDNDVVVEGVQATGRFYWNGLARVHFTLPTTADQTAIDVRDIDVDLRPVRRPLAWLIGSECGGQQYHREYAVVIHEGESTIFEPGRGSASVPRPFEPFSVHPGESVFLTFRITACDHATYALRFEIDYVADTGDKVKAFVNAGEVSTTGAPRSVIFVEGKPVEVGPARNAPLRTEQTCRGS